MNIDFTKYFNGPTAENIRQYVEAEFDYNKLSKELRLLTFISASQASKQMAELKGLIKWALDSSVKPAEIYEVLLQGYLFLGYPVAIESFFVFDEVLNPKPVTRDNLFDKTPVWDYHHLKSLGARTAEKIYAEKFNPVFNNIWGLSPELASGMVIEGYGRIISRPGLNLIVRELAVVSALTVTDMPRQLYSHIKGSTNVGANPIQIRAAIEQCRYFVKPQIIDKALSIFFLLLGKITYPK